MAINFKSPDKRINLDIDSNLWKEVGMLAVQLDATKRAIVHKALHDFIESQKTEPTQEQ